jgi:glycosyltransferase involved in cell wall biosynthesis
MRVLVSTEQRFGRRDGRVETAGPLDYGFWKRYLGVFDEVAVLARVHREPLATGRGREVSGPGVSVVEAPAYLGPSGYLSCLPRLVHAVDGAARLRGAVIVRAPSPLGSLLLRRRRRQGRSAFGLEVIGDPREVFSRGRVRHPLGPLLGRLLAAGLRARCRQASALAYVTHASLQARYPPRPVPAGQFVTSCASADLSASALVARPRDPASFRSPFRLVTVASLEQPYKGVDVLVRAAGECHRRGLSLALLVVGEGRERPALEALGRAELPADRVAFAGQVAPKDVTAHLDASHLFVLASRTEGLPQAMIEAMARGLPCLGSDVGGIPELLEARDLVPAGDACAFAAAIARVLGSPADLAAMSARNLAAAREYTATVQGPRRTAFHEAVRDATLAEEEGPAA